MSEKTKLIPIVGTENEDRTADIVFVHGLGGDALGTWHPDGKKEKEEVKNSWLTWLGDDFSDKGIWSVAYEVEPFRWKGSTMPLADRATNIVDLLDTYEIGERPLIFITHMLRLANRIRALIDKVCLRRLDISRNLIVRVGGFFCIAAVSTVKLKRFVCQSDVQCLMPEVSQNC